MQSVHFLYSLEQRVRADAATDRSSYCKTEDFSLVSCSRGSAQPKGKAAGSVYSAIKQEGRLVSVLIGL